MENAECPHLMFNYFSFLEYRDNLLIKLQIIEQIVNIFAVKDLRILDIFIFDEFDNFAF